MYFKITQDKGETFITQVWNVLMQTFIIMETKIKPAWDNPFFLAFILN